MLYRGSCHCGRVALEVEGVLERVSVCNCSICTRKGYLHWIVPRESVRLEVEEDALETYRFGTRLAKHHFCRTCGVAPFYIARSDPEKIDVNARCLEDIEASQLPVVHFDGRHWEEAVRAERGEPGS